MSALPVIPTDKLAKLLPRLASGHPGEVIATAQGIVRTLQSAGADLHDLADLVRSARQLPPQPPPPPPPPAGAPTGPYRPQFQRWRKRNSGERIMACDALLGLKNVSDWERMFIRDITDLVYADPSYPLTARQIAVIDKLLARAWQQDFGEWAT